MAICEACATSSLWAWRPPDHHRLSSQRFFFMWQNQQPLESSQQWGPAIGSINGAQERTVNGNHLDCIFSDRSTSALSGSRSDSDNLMKHEWKAGRRNVDFCNWVKSANKLPTKLPSTTISYHQSPTSRLEEIYRLSIWAWLFPQGARKAELFSTWWGSQAHWRHSNFHIRTPFPHLHIHACRSHVSIKTPTWKVMKHPGPSGLALLSPVLRTRVGVSFRLNQKVCFLMFPASPAVERTSNE